jgi:hypothetical protein
MEVIRSCSKLQNPLATIPTPLSAKHSKESSVLRLGTIDEVPRGQLEVNLAQVGNPQFPAIDELFQHRTGASDN